MILTGFQGGLGLLLEYCTVSLHGSAHSDCGVCTVGASPRSVDISVPICVCLIVCVVNSERPLTCVLYSSH